MPWANWQLHSRSENGRNLGLLEALQDRQGDIRVSAARALGKLGDERALTGLTRLLADYGVTTTGTTVTVKETAEEAIRHIQSKKEAR